LGRIKISGFIVIVLIYLFFFFFLLQAKHPDLVPAKNIPPALQSVFKSKSLLGMLPKSFLEKYSSIITPPPEEPPAVNTEETSGEGGESTSTTLDDPLLLSLGVSLGGDENNNGKYVFCFF
jgi:hypothetical protein